MTGTHPLSPGREAFAVAGGATGAAAIRFAYPRSRRWTPGAVYSRATRLMHLPEVASRIAELRRADAKVAATDPALPAPSVNSDNGRFRRMRLRGILQCVTNQGATSKAEAREIAKWNPYCFDADDTDAVADMWQEHQDAL